MGDDAYARRNRRKKAKGYGCGWLLIAAAGLSVFAAETARWLA